MITVKDMEFGTLMKDKVHRSEIFDAPLGRATGRALKIYILTNFTKFGTLMKDKVHVCIKARNL